MCLHRPSIPQPPLWSGRILRRHHRSIAGGYQESGSRHHLSSTTSAPQPTPPPSPSPRRQRRRLRPLDEAFPDLKARFEDMSIEVPPAHRRHRRGTPVLLMPHPFSRVFPLLTLRQRDHFFKRYRKTTTGSASASSNGSNLPVGEAPDPPRAAVLVLLCTVNQEASLVLTRRSPRMASHAGEISFPGGHYDPRSDSDLLDTALREAREELNPVDPHCLEWGDTTDDDDDDDDDPQRAAPRPRLAVLGPTTSVPSLRGIPVKPFVAALLHRNLSHPISSVFPGDHGEVDLVFSMTIRELLQRETTHELPQNRFGMVHAPLFPTPYGSDIWGLTAFILRPLLHKLLGPVLVGDTNSNVGGGSNEHEPEGSET